MFFNAELESELSESEDLTKATTYFKCDRDREALMSKIEEDRVFNAYPHDQLPSCQKKGMCACK